MADPTSVRLHPPVDLDVEVRPPGSKSLTNRALPLAGLAKGRRRSMDAARLFGDYDRILAGNRSERQRGE